MDEREWEGVIVYCSREELLSVPGATPLLVDPWWSGMYQYRTSKAARCEPNAVKVTEWYCMPVIAEAIKMGVSLMAYRLTHFEARQARRKEAGLSNSTLRREAMEMDGLFGVAVRERLIKRNPLADYKMVPKVKAYVPCPTPAQFDALLAAPKIHYRPSVTSGMAHLTRRKLNYLCPRDVAAIAVTGRAAMRTAEVFNLRLSDYQPSENRMVVRKAKDHEWRFVPIYDDVINAVNSYLKVRPASDNDLLFINDRGDKITVDWWSKHFKAFARIAGCPEVTPRGLRHYGLTAMAKVNLLAAQAAGGHTSPVTTKGYLHNDWEHTKEALAAVPHANVSVAKDRRSGKRMI